MLQNSQQQSAKLQRLVCLRFLLHELEADAEMVAEVEVVEHVDDIVRTVSVLLAQMVQDANLYQCLVVEPLLIPVNTTVSQQGYKTKMI